MPEPALTDSPLADCEPFRYMLLRGEKGMQDSNGREALYSNSHNLGTLPRFLGSEDDLLRAFPDRVVGLRAVVCPYLKSRSAYVSVRQTMSGECRSIRFQNLGCLPRDQGVAHCTFQLTRLSDVT